MRRSSFSEPKTVLIFNSKRKLIAIAKSLHECSKITKITAQSISLACTGKRVICHNFYFRHLHPNVEINIEEDFGILDVMEYDKMNKEVRYYYPKNKTSTYYKRKPCTSEQIDKLEE